MVSCGARSLSIRGPARTREVERLAEIARVRAHARERLEAEALRDELDDRGCVVRRLVDEAALGEGGDDDRGDPRSRAPSVAPAWSRGRRHVVPVAAVLVVGDDHGHPGPLRALAQTL